MKVFIYYSRLGNKGGITSQACFYAEALMQRGHQVTVAGLGRPPWESLPGNFAGAEYVSGAYLPKRKWFSRWELDSSEMLCARVVRHLQKNRYDIVHCLGWSPTNVNVFWAGMVNGAKTLYTATSTADKLYPVDFEYCGLLLNGVHGPAQSIAETISQRMHNRGKYYVFPTCSDRLRHTVNLRQGSDYSLGFIGNLEKHKLVDRLVDVWAEVCKLSDKSHLHFFGAGSLEDSIKDQAKNLGIGNKVTLHGYEADLSVVFSQITASIVMSREGLSLATVEALCAGRQVILPRDGCFPEIYGDCEAAKFFESNASDAELAMTIVEGLDQARRESIRREARTFFEKRFSPEVVSEQLINCYQDLLVSKN